MIKLYVNVFSGGSESVRRQCLASVYEYFVASHALKWFNTAIGVQAAPPAARPNGLATTFFNCLR